MGSKSIKAHTLPPYKKRFIAEYYQLEDRIIKLQNVVDAIKNKTLTFEPSSPSDILEAQLAAMKDYARMLIIRSFIEDVPLNISIGLIYKEAIEMHEARMKK